MKGVPVDSLDPNLLPPLVPVRPLVQLALRIFSTELGLIVDFRKFQFVVRYRGRRWQLCIGAMD